jgi:hypothetical protein
VAAHASRQKAKRLLESGSQTSCIDCLDGGEERDVRQIDVFGSAGALETQLEHQTAFERCCITKHCDHTRQKAVEYEQLAFAWECDAAGRRHSQALLQRLLEGFR